MNINKYRSELKVVAKTGKEYYECAVRKNLILKTPEEEVRQLLLFCLINEFEVPEANIWVEGGLNQVFNDIEQKGRFDIIIFKDSKIDGRYVEREIVALIECKRADKIMSDSAFDQLDFYQQDLAAMYSILTNVEETIIRYYNTVKSRYEYLATVPLFEKMAVGNNSGIKVLAHEDIHSGKITLLQE